jgi:SMC interacting uncharacterized protein involved in chromosome segregation
MSEVLSSASPSSDYQLSSRNLEDASSQRDDLLTVAKDAWLEAQAKLKKANAALTKWQSLNKRTLSPTGRSEKDRLERDVEGAEQKVKDALEQLTIINQLVKDEDQRRKDALRTEKSTKSTGTSSFLFYLLK